jgi:apolipoprotein N-acyltransferase
MKHRRAIADSESFLQVASYGGVFLLGLIAVFINFLFYRSVLRFQAKKSWLPLAGGMVLVIGILVGMPLASLRETFEGKNFKTLSVGIMSLHESGMEKQDLEKKVEELSKEGAKLIVLPEGARFFSRGSEVLMAEPATIIDSSQLTVSGHRRDVFASFAGVLGAEKETFVRSKLVLSPQGEYHVALFSVLFSLFGFENKLEEIGNISRYSAGGIGNAAVLLDGTRASILFCIEMLAPGLGKQLVTEQESDVLVTLISQRRFTYSYSMQVDTERFLKVQAVEAGVPLVASSNHAPAYAFDAYGRIIKILGANRIGVHAVVDVPVPQD